MTGEKTRKKKIVILILAAAVCAALLGAAARTFFSKNIVFNGEVISRQTEVLDLRGREVTPQELQGLRDKLPGARIITDIKIGGVVFSSEDREIVTGDFTIDDLPLFDGFEALSRVDASACGNIDIIQLLEARLPDTEVVWTVPLAGQTLDGHTASVKVDTVTKEELSAALERLPYVTEVSVTKRCLTSAEQLELWGAYPSVKFTWRVTLAGRNFTGREERLLFPDPVTEEELEEIGEGLVLLPAAKSLEFKETGLSDSVMMRFADSHEQVTVEWYTELFGVEFSTGAEVVCFDNIPMTVEDAAEIEDMLPYMPRLKKVEMLHCGLTNEEMDALNKRHEDVDFVWMVNVYGYGVRTDQTYFSIYNCPLIYENNGVADQLRYCHDMIAIDLGHMHLYGDLDFFNELPHLRYLILAMAAYREIPQLASLQELEWLELCQTSFTDLTPLLELKNLRHLNIAYKKVPTEEQRRIDVDQLKQMTWLERLWIGGNMYKESQVEELRQALPNTEIHIVRGTETMEGGWRSVEAYFEMRDANHMYYMNDYGKTVEINPYTGERSEYEWTNPFRK